MMLFYDADSSLGIDNKGNLAFDYYLEDIDYTDSGDPVFNGQASVLWVNLRKCFYDKIEQEYKRLRTTVRSDGSGNTLISYDVVNNLFESHQGKWSEAIYNEDGHRKSIEPYLVEGSEMYLPMLQGKKEQQRKWWLYNRFRYLDSKYNTGSSMETRIIIRAKSKGNIKLKSYVNMYGHVYYNAEMVEHRMTRGQEYEFVWAATGAEDAVIGINDADMLTSLGDLSPLMVEHIDVAKATHLVELKVGDPSPDYVNNSLNGIALGKNILMKIIDFRNCTALAQTIDASGCTGLEEAYFDNTSITGLSLPNGGNIRILHLPETMTNLTLRNQKKLTEFIIPSYKNVTTLWLEDNSEAVDPVSILNSISPNSRVRIIGLNVEMSGDELSKFIRTLESMRGLDERGENTNLAQVSGRVFVSEINGMDLALAEKYIGLTVEYGSVYLNSTRLVERTLRGDYTNDRVTTIGPCAFYGCWGLNSIVFTKARYLNAQAFASTGVKHVDLHVTSGFGYRVFSGCSLDTVILRYTAGKVTHVPGGAMYRSLNNLYVPAALVDDYIADNNDGDGYSSWHGITNVYAIEDHPDICGGES
jgi:hypothetical protein